MKCDKCKKDFPENKIQDSHDIPKYMGGEDKDGRHYLCKECHDKYELKILKLGLMSYIKNMNDFDKSIFRRAARIVRGYFFEEEKNGDSISKF